MRNKILLKVLFYLTLFLNLVFVLQVFGSLTEKELSYFFNSDALYLPSIYKDIFVDESGFAGWHLNAAPNFFPEWPVYFILYYIAGNFKIASLLYSIFYVLAVNVLTAGIIKYVFEKIDFRYLILVNLGYAIFLHQYLVMGYFVETAYLFLVGFHGGTYLMALISLLFFLFYFKKGTTVYFVLLSLSVFLGVLSDRFLIMYFVVPSLLALFFIGNKRHRKRIILSSVGSIFSTVLGMITYSFIKNSDYLYIIGLGYRKFDSQKIESAGINYVNKLNGMLEAGGIEMIIIIISIISIIAGIYLFLNALFAKGKIYNNLKEKLLVVFFTGFIIIVALTPVVHGTFSPSGAHLRYNFSAFYIAVSFIPVILFLLVRKIPKLSTGVSILTLMLIIAAIFSVIRNEKNNSTIHGLISFKNYYPEEVKLIDEIAKKHNLQFGIANYWYAKRTTMFSKENVRIYAVHDNLRPWYHVTNENWYHSGGKGKYHTPRFSFILLNNLTPEGEFYQQLKNDADSLSNGKIDILKVPEFGYKGNKEPYFLNE
jgi:hypothetical protein